MAITAKFEADFTQFRGAVDSASGTLKTFETGVGTVGTGLLGMSTRSQETTPHVHNLRSAMGQFDGVLASMGVHIGPEIRALGELGDASGRSASQIGLLGTAGLALGAGLGGWKIGRAVADFFDLDEMIGKATASLLGLGDAAAQEAGAGMDVLMRATQIAGREITNFAEAQQIVIDANLHFQASMNTSEFRTSQWRAELDRVAKGGSLEILRLELASHNSTLQELSAQYGISVRALDAFQRSSAATAEAQAKDTAIMTAATVKLHGALERLAFLGDGWKTTLAAIDPVTKTAIQDFLVLGAAQSDLAIKFGLSALQIKAVAQGMDEQTLIMGLTEPKLGSLTEFVKAAAKATSDWDISLGFTEESLKAVIPVIDAVIPKVNALTMTYWEAIDAQAKALGIQPVGLRPGETKNPDGSVNYPRPIGGTVSGAGVGMGDTTNEERAKNRLGSPFGPPSDLYAARDWLGQPTSGTTVNNTIYVNGTAEDVARKVAAEMLRTVQRGTLVS